MISMKDKRCFWEKKKTLKTTILSRGLKTTFFMFWICHSSKSLIIILVLNVHIKIAFFIINLKTQNIKSFKTFLELYEPLQPKTLF